MSVRLSEMTAASAAGFDLQLSMKLRVEKNKESEPLMAGSQAIEKIEKQDRGKVEQDLRKL